MLNTDYEIDTKAIVISHITVYLSLIVRKTQVIVYGYDFLLVMIVRLVRILNLIGIFFFQ